MGLGVDKSGLKKDFKYPRTQQSYTRPGQERIGQKGWRYHPLKKKNGPQAPVSREDARASVRRARPKDPLRRIYQVLVIS